jgi:hypothetical protein
MLVKKATEDRSASRTCDEDSLEIMDYDIQPLCGCEFWVVNTPDSARGDVSLTPLGLNQRDYVVVDYSRMWILT